MKLATLMDGSRDGQLAVVSRDLTLAHFATGIATTLQQLLDDWNFVSPQLEDLYATLNGGKARHAFPFEPARTAAPLPRPVAWWRAGPEGVAAAAGGALGGGEGTVADPAAPAALVPRLAWVLGDLPAAADADTALESLRLVMLGLDWHDAEGELGSRFGPVAVTPDEFGPSWAKGRCQGQLRLQRQGRPWARADAAQAWPGGLGELVAQLARRRPLASGSVVATALQMQGDDADSPPMSLSIAAGDRFTLTLDGVAGADGGAPLGSLGLQFASAATPS